MSSSADDDLAIRSLRQRWAFHRDQGDFTGMSGCFHPEATASISWFNGKVADLVPLLAASDAARKPGEHGKHGVGNCRVEQRGDRALLESDMAILIREYIDGQLFDYTGHCRFLDQVERRAGKWGILHWTAIFDKDRLDPAQGEAPAWLREVDLATPDAGLAFMRLRQRRKGRDVPASTVVGGSEAERQLRRDAWAWLERRDGQ